MRFLAGRPTCLRRSTFNAETVCAPPARAGVSSTAALRSRSLDERETAAAAAEEEDKRPAGREIYRFDGGLVDYVRYLNADKTPLHEEPI